MSSLCTYHSAKLEYGPPTPYSESPEDVKRKLNQTHLDLTEYGIFMGAYEEMEGREEKDLNTQLSSIRNSVLDITPEHIIQSVNRNVTYGNRNFV